MSLLKKHWSQINGPVHPEDAAIFQGAANHSFNLQFPPPAFVGNIDAPIIVLMSNGGYKAGLTEEEFPDAAAVEEHLAFLRGDTETMPERLSSYYRRGPFGSMLEDGSVLLINAVPYRSPQLSSEPVNKALARRLPSVDVHRQWLFGEALPEARKGARLILAHRNKWWGLPISEASDTIIFSDNRRAEPNRRAPDSQKIDWAKTWLRSR